MGAPDMIRPQTIVVAAKLHKNQLERHLELFEHIPEVGRVVVVRREPLPERLSKLENFGFAPSTLGVEAVRMYRAVRTAAAQSQAKWVIGFNPVPWGSIATAATWKTGTKTCLSLIGMDFQQVQSWWGKPFLAAVRRADAVTVTGEAMVTRLTELGVSPQKLFVLPHSVDTERFCPKGDLARRWDIVTVGQLIERKRMDVLISALALAKQRGHTLTLGILGQGPLEAELKRQVTQLGLDAQVDFLGYQDEVESVLRTAGVFCLGSAWEGVPFALMESMATGLVPVVTDVGTIGDWVHHGQNGWLVPVGDAHALADALILLRPGQEPWTSLRSKVIEQRKALSFEHGALVWRKVLGV
jgi:glycosyltransferase involved in cell wall biosynthesis